MFDGVCYFVTRALRTRFAFTAASHHINMAAGFRLPNYLRLLHIFTIKFFVIELFRDWPAGGLRMGKFGQGPASPRAVAAPRMANE